MTANVIVYSTGRHEVKGLKGSELMGAKRVVTFLTKAGEWQANSAAQVFDRLRSRIGRSMLISYPLQENKPF